MASSDQESSHGDVKTKKGNNCAQRERERERQRESQGKSKMFGSRRQCTDTKKSEEDDRKCAASLNSGTRKNVHKCLVNVNFGPEYDLLG